MHLNIKSCKKE